MCMREDRFVKITEENAVAICNGPVPPQTLRIGGVLFRYDAEVRRWFGADGRVVGWGRLDDLIDAQTVPVYALVEA